MALSTSVPRKPIASFWAFRYLLTTSITNWYLALSTDRIQVHCFLLWLMIDELVLNWFYHEENPTNLFPQSLFFPINISRLLHLSVHLRLQHSDLPWIVYSYFIVVYKFPCSIYLASSVYFCICIFMKLTHLLASFGLLFYHLCMLPLVFSWLLCSLLLLPFPYAWLK